jgi:hypothetical protein
MDDWGSSSSAPNWSNKSDEQICVGMHLVFENDAAAFIDHIVRDQGNIQFIEAGFKGLRGLTDGGRDIYENEKGKTIVPEPPPGTHAQLIAQARAWVAAQGGKFVGDKDCGCIVAETGEVYLLAIRIVDLRGVGGMIVVTDSVTMKIRIQDTTVTVYALKNFKPSAVPGEVASNFGVKSVTRWVDDEIGHMNIVTAAGYLSVDFPAEGDRTLKVDFTHSDARYPEFVTTYATGAKHREGGGPFPHAFPFSSTFNIGEGKSVYEVSGRGANFKLTLLSSTEQKKGK